MSVQGPILVPLDGSELAERAVPVAAELSRRADAGLLLAHVHAPLSPDPIHMEGLPLLDEELRPLRRQHEQAYLADVSRRLGAGLAISTLLLEGPVAAALAAQARSSGARLVVMTTHGRGGFERAWLGSVADEMARISPVPLLLLRPEPGARPGPFRRILVPLDGSPLAEAILESAVAFARLEPESELLLLRVVHSVVTAAWVADPAPAAALAARELAAQQQRAHDYLAGVVHRLLAAGLRARALVEVDPNVPAAILRTARAEQSDLVALATHGRSGLGRLVLGSVADKLVRGSPTPILLLRPAPAPAA
jgi:nucleotide-binding universal stress UspA family protein